MLVGCLSFNRKDNENCSIETIVKAHFQFYQYEQIDQAGMISFISWNIKKEVIWQLVLLLESSNVKVGYGFGQSKERAQKACEETYERRMRLM